jgi:hypothetical protein
MLRRGLATQARVPIRADGRAVGDAPSRHDGGPGPLQIAIEPPGRGRIPGRGRFGREFATLLARPWRVAHNSAAPFPGVVTVRSLVALSFCIVATGCGRPATPASAAANSPTMGIAPTPNPTVRVPADELQARYRANEIDADDRYKGQACEVTGVVESVGKSTFPEICYVVLQSGGMLQGVHCRFDLSHENTLAKLRKGQQVTVWGTCTGMTLGSPSLKNCTLHD